ncbi:transporter [Shewanella psychrophila]|nr:transporter [Shewanella psychrophila]
MPALPHQPVMDMAPRWQGGWGFQLRRQSISSDTLLDDTTQITNESGLSRRVDTLWLEGIYTFKREIRLSFKLPYIVQSRTVMKDTEPVNETGSGIGDLIIGLPLKRYWNETDSTGNIAITPSIRLPTGGTGASFPVGDGSTDLGLSLSVSFEGAKLYQYYDLFYWVNNKGDMGINKGDEFGLDINIGWHLYHDNLSNTGIFLMLDISAALEQEGRDSAGITGGKRLYSGPVFVWYRAGVMFRAEYKFPLYEDVEGIQISHGDEFTLGIGFVF